MMTTSMMMIIIKLDSSQPPLYVGIPMKKEEKKIIGNVNSALCHPARHDEVKVTRGAVASTAKGLYLCPRSPSYLRHTDVVLRYCTKVRVCSRSARRPRAKLG